MGHTLLGVLGLFLLSTLLYGHAEGGDAVLEIPAFTLFEGDWVTLSCKNRTSGRTMTATFFKDGSPVKLDTNHWSYITGEMIIDPVSVSDVGWYKCKIDDETESEERELRVKAGRRTVTLTADSTIIPLGGSVTLTCSVEDPDGFNYQWYRETSDSRQTYLQSENVKESHRVISQGGKYTCYGWRSEPDVFTPYSNAVFIEGTEIVLTVSPSWLSAGASVTLTCRVKDPSAGWRFYWYKAVPDPSNNYYSYELLPGSSSGTEQDSYIVHGQTHTAGYMCRAGRGDPVYYTFYSETNFVWSADFHPSASLTVSPDRAQHFTSDSVSLSCEGNSAEWRVKMLLTTNRYSSCHSYWGTMTGSTCKLNSYWRSDAVYWCESGSGEFSNAVNITIHNGDVILLSPARPVTEGDSVSLSCKLKSQRFTSTVFFYHNEKVIQNDSRWELNISAVSKSDEGFYKCQHSGQESAQSWMSVQAESRPESSSLPVLLIVGLVCGVVLVIPLLVLFCYRASKGPCSVRCRRPVQSEGANADRGDYENDHYSALRHGDVCLYETIRGRQEAEHDSRSVRPVQSEGANADRGDYENDHYSSLLHGDACLYETIRGRQQAEHDQ